MSEEAEGKPAELLCRGCLTPDQNNMKSIFTTATITNKDLRLCTILNYCTNLDAYEGDGLPNLLCDTCTQDIIKSFILKQQFIRANYILREKLATLSNKQTSNELFEQVEPPENVDISSEKHENSQQICTEEQIKNEKSGDNDDSFDIDRCSDEDDDDQDNVEQIDELKEEITMQNYDSSDDETLKKKAELQEKLKTLPNNTERSELTQKAIKLYLKDYKKRPKGSKQNFECTICNKTLCSATSLKTHMLTHTNETPFLCSICGKGFKTKTSYQEHLVTHDPTDPFKCTQCDKVYKNVRKLKDHQLRAHSKVKPFLCGVCGKGLTQKDSLMKHMMIHTGEKPFECDLCGKHFRYMSVLKLHKRYHTGERPYPCTECDKRFKERTHLRKHLMIHTGEKPYECDFCGKCFHTRTNLNSHRKIHTGERNHKCPVCGKGFIQPNCMRAHLATHDKQKQSTPSDAQQQPDIDEVASAPGASSQMQDLGTGYHQQIIIQTLAPHESQSSGIVTEQSHELSQKVEEQYLIQDGSIVY